MTFFKTYGLPALTFVVLIALWEVAVRALDLPSFLLPPPSAIAREVVVWRGLIIGHAFVTLYETVAGFALAIVVGIPLGILVVYSRTLQNTIYPLLLVAQSVPKVAIAPLFLIWIGYGLTSKILIALLVAFFPIVIDTATGLNAIEPEMIDLSRSLRAKPLQIFWKVRLPFALPFIFSGLKVAITLAIIGAVIAEFVGSDKGLGYQILEATSQIKTALVFADIVLLSIMGIVLFFALVALERVLMPWHVSTQEAVSGSM